MFSYEYILGIYMGKSQSAAAEIPSVVRTLTSEGFFCVGMLLCYTLFPYCGHNHFIQLIPVAWRRFVHRVQGRHADCSVKIYFSNVIGLQYKRKRNMKLTYLNSCRTEGYNNSDIIYVCVCKALNTV